MDDLNLPIFKGEPFPPPTLSMDEFLSFSLWMKDIFFNKEAYERQKKEEAVNARFYFKTD